MEDTQQKLVRKLEEWQEDELAIYDYFIAKALSFTNLKIRRPENKVKGCASGLWFAVSLNNGMIEAVADSDSLIIKGIALSICEIYNGMTLEAAKKTEITFLNNFDLAGELDENRRNGLGQISQIIRKL